MYDLELAGTILPLLILLYYYYYYYKMRQQLGEHGFVDSILPP